MPNASSFYLRCFPYLTAITPHIFFTIHSTHANRTLRVYTASILSASENGIFGRFPSFQPQNGRVNRVLDVGATDDVSDIRIRFSRSGLFLSLSRALLPRHIP